MFIDARYGEANLLETVPEGVAPDLSITIKPEYIVQFSEGNLVPRLGMFKDALFHEPSMPKGDIPKAVRFADLLTPAAPGPLPSIDSLNMVALPKATEDIKQIRKDIREFGYASVNSTFILDRYTTFLPKLG